MCIFNWTEVINVFFLNGKIIKGPQTVLVLKQMKTLVSHIYIYLHRVKKN